MTTTQATLVVDGRTQLDDTLDEWHRRPPEIIAEMIKPGANPQPYLKAAALALAEATITHKSVHIDITTLPNGWTLTVIHP